MVRSRPVFTKAGESRYFRGQDGRVVKASFFCETAMVTRGFETRLQILSPHKKSIGWAVGAEVTSRRYYGRRKPIFGQQDGRVVKSPSFGGERTKYTPDMPGSNPAANKVHRRGGW